MKFILFIIITMSHQNDGHTPVAVDHIEFRNQAACEQMKTKIESGSQSTKSSGFMGAVNVINGALNGPIINARCEGVEDTAAE